MNTSAIFQRIAKGFSDMRLAENFLNLTLNSFEKLTVSLFALAQCPLDLERVNNPQNIFGDTIIHGGHIKDY